MRVLCAGRVMAFLLVTCPCLGMFCAPAQGQETSQRSTTESQAKSAAPAEDRVVLKVGNVQVTEAEFESRINDIEPNGENEGEKAASSDKDRRKLADDYASVLMLSQLAVADHLDSSAEVSRKLAVARLQVLSDAEFNSLMNQAKPSFEEINRYYSAHLSDYDQVQIRRLFIWKQRNNRKDAPILSSQAARAIADRIRQEYSAGAGPQKVADDLRRSGDGMFDPEPLTFPRGELSPQLEKVAFALKEGEWSEIQDTPASFLLIQLVKRDRKQLGEVSAAITSELQGQKLEEMLNSLKKKTGIWMDEKYFGTAVAPVPSGAMPGSGSPPADRNSASNNPGENK